MLQKIIAWKTVWKVVSYKTKQNKNLHILLSTVMPFLETYPTKILIFEWKDKLKQGCSLKPKNEKLPKGSSQETG